MRRVGIVVLVVLCAVACRAPKASGPSWPAASTTAEDGGESLEPRTTVVAASVEKSVDDDQPSKSSGESKPETAAVPSSDDKPATTSAPSAPATEDILMTDELIIEIDE